MILEKFSASKPNGIGVLVVPGGGYEFISYEKEGAAPARWLNDRGYDAWVLTYTIADAEKGEPISPKPQDDVRTALEEIRHGHRLKKLGIWGWSAGGHLSALTVTDQDSKLDFAILAYPVITMEQGITHPGSRRNLIGDNPSTDVEEELSAHKRVTNETPPVFLFHTANDEKVSIENSRSFAKAMRRHNRPHFLHTLPDGPHGIGLALDDPKRSWTDKLDDWLKSLM